MTSTCGSAHARRGNKKRRAKSLSMSKSMLDSCSFEQQKLERERSVKLSSLHPFLEGCQSGRLSTLGKRVCSSKSTVGSNPTPSVVLSLNSDQTNSFLDRASQQFGLRQLGIRSEEPYFALAKWRGTGLEGNPTPSVTLLQIRDQTNSFLDRASKVVWLNESINP